MPGLQEQPARAEQQEEISGDASRRGSCAGAAGGCVRPATASAGTSAMRRAVGRWRAPPSRWRTPCRRWRGRGRAPPRRGSRAVRSGNRRSGCEKNKRPMPDSTGFPRYRCSGGMASGRDAALKRLPMTRSAPPRSALDERGQRGEVVAVVGVAHDHVAAARGRDAGAQRAAVAFCAARARRARRPARAIPTDPSLLPLSAISTSPATPLRSR